MILKLFKYLPTGLLGLFCCIVPAQLKAQKDVTADAVPVTEVLLKEIDAQLTFPGGKWKRTDSTQAGLVGHSLLYVKDFKPNSTEMDLYAVVRTEHKKANPMQGLGNILGEVLGGSDEKKQQIDMLKEMLDVTYKVTDLSARTPPLIKDFKNAIALELIAREKAESGYLVQLVKDDVVVSIYILSSYQEFPGNKPEMLNILRSISAIKNQKTLPTAANVKSNAKLPAGIVSEFLPICNGYSYTYTEYDPILGKVTHTKSYEKAPGKMVNGKQFKGFLIRCTNPFLDGRYEYYNFENGILRVHKENEGFSTSSFEEYNIFNPAERRTSYETRLEGKNTFTTSVVLKTNAPEGSSWSEKTVDAGYTSTSKYTILEKGVTVKAGDKSYTNVTIVGQQINATIVTTGTQVSMNIKTYFAKGIGLIKTEIQKGSENTTQSVMETFAF